MSQPRPPERTERFLAIPCRRRGVDHVYEILDYEHPSGRVTYRGWLSRERSEELFGREGIYFSGSHGLCPQCRKAFDEML